ncbi:MAG TPA: glycoside hydrolase family 5 protein [Acidisarcina sp.]
MRRKLSLATTLVLVLAGLISMASAQQAGSGLAFERAKHLQHGVNASIWFAQSPHDYSQQRLQTFTTADDIALMAHMGLDHARLSVDADPLTAWQRGRPANSDYFMTELDRVVKMMLDNHLSVIIDIHPESSYKRPLQQGSESVQQFVSLWRAVATHFASSDPDHVFFEIMNEPEQPDTYRWQGIESAVAAAIREVAPKHTIIAAGAHWSGLQDLLLLEPLADPNVIYTFHDYEPFAFTHQGATWTSPEVRPERGIPYPSTPENVAPKLSQQPDLEGEYFVSQYGLGRWDAARVESDIDFAARWGKLHHVPVYCGEFGVLREYANPAMRAQWLHDMRVAMERHNIGWAMWDYQTNFGMVTKQDSKTTPDADVLKALALHMPGQ